MGMDEPTVMSMATRTMTKTADLLTLSQWLSPAFPIGGFAYSHGLETLVAIGDVNSAESLQEWLKALIIHGSIKSDAVLLFRGFHADSIEGLLETNADAQAFATTPERRRETGLQGNAFVETCNAIWGFDLPSLTLPVAVGAAAARKGMGVETVQPLYLQSVISNLISVAVRLVPLGQTDGQRVLAALQPDILNIPCEDGPLFSNAFLWDHAAMHHETLQPKLFRS